MRSITRRGSIAGIAASDLPKLEIPLPPLQEQIQISKLLKIVTEKKGNYLTQRENSIALRLALCNNLLPSVRSVG